MRMTSEFEIKFSPDFQSALSYMRSLENYSPTPIETVDTGLGFAAMIKNERNRLGLGSFKALGGPYAVAQLIRQNWQEQTGKELALNRLQNPDVRAFSAELTFVTASAGNHGIGVAAGAQALGANAVIILSETVPVSFETRVAAFDATIIRTGHNYDASVEAAAREAKTRSAILLSDGSWPGYMEIPKLVMEGYTVMAEELRSSFETSGEWPTHVYLQAGVGGLAAAVTWMIRHNWSEQPDIIIVEPKVATCLYDSHCAGKLVTVEGPVSDMGRLDCKAASLIAWDVLEGSGVSYLSITDDEGIAAATALTNLGFPTTSSGAAGYAGLLKYGARVGSSSPVRSLVFITETV